jgi:hypothetical protein
LNPHQELNGGTLAAQDTRCQRVNFDLHQVRRIANISMDELRVLRSDSIGFGLMKKKGAPSRTPNPNREPDQAAASFC